MQHISLTPDKELNSVRYGTIFHVNIYRSYKLLKTVGFYLAHTVHNNFHHMQKKSAMCKVKPLHHSQTACCKL